MGYYLFYTTYTKRIIKLMRRENKDRNPSPQNDRRGCLCKDGKTYSRKCCDGSFQAQGIGNITGTE